MPPSCLTRTCRVRPWSATAIEMSSPALGGENGSCGAPAVSRRRGPGTREEMWGSWMGVTLTGVVAALLLIAAAATAWTPLFAIGIAAVAIAGFAVFFAIRGGEIAGGIWGEKREA